MLWPPYWLLATCATICVAMLQAVEKLCGFSMSVPVMTVPVLQHVFEVYEVTVVHVLREIVHIMEMDNALLVCFDDFARKQMRRVMSLETSPAM